jgi:hypothetical protein
MAKISAYQFDSKVTKDDFVIGSDYATKFTRNYKLQDIANFFGTLQPILGDKFAYIYDQSDAYFELSQQEISFNNKAQLNTQFSGVTEIYLHKLNDTDVDVTSYFQSLLNEGTLRINNGSRTTDYGVYRVQGVEALQNNVLKISVDLLLSNGTITNGDPAVISADISSVDRHFKTPLLEGTVWEIEHNLGKFPSVTVVDTANNVIYSDVAYDDLNNVTITFASSVTGYAYFN